MASLQEVESRALATAGVTSIANFTKSMSNPDLNTLRQGDLFMIPEGYKVFSQAMGETNTAEFTFVQMIGTDGRTPTGEAKQFYPSQLNKSRTVYGKDKIPTTRRVIASGTACDLFRSKMSIQEGVEALKGKVIRVTTETPVLTLRYGTSDQLMNTSILNFDLV